MNRLELDDESSSSSLSDEWASGVQSCASFSTGYSVQFTDIIFFLCLSLLSDVWVLMVCAACVRCDV